MDFQFSDQEKAFRQELRQFLDDEFPKDFIGFEYGEDHSEKAWPLTRRIVKKLAEKGWLTLSWPKEYGGQGRSHMEKLIYLEEMSHRGVPGLDMGIGGISWVGPILMLYGSEEQKRKHLPKIARGEEFWCTGYSEPGFGSDLSALECRADRQGDDYIVKGTKIWTSGAHIADWCWLAVRTNDRGPKHKGISLLLVDMKSPGITIRPLVNMAGFHQLNEVIFDQVRVPKGNLVGEENKGWYYVAQALDFERTSTRDIARIKRLLDELIKYVKMTRKNGEPLAKDPLIRQKIAKIATDLRVAQLLDMRVVWMQSKGLIPNYEASIAKIVCSELAVRTAHTGMQILGLYSQFDQDSKWAKIRGWITHAGLYYLHQPISRGTNEIQRNIIAQRGLGLPRQ